MLPLAETPRLCGAARARVARDLKRVLTGSPSRHPPALCSNKQGCIFTINGLISIAGAAPSGWVTDHLPGHPLLAGSLLLQVRRPLCAVCLLQRAVRVQSASEPRASHPHVPARPPFPSPRKNDAKALGLSLIASRASLAGVAAAFAGVALTWNVLNTAGNVLALQQAPEVRGS